MLRQRHTYESILKVPEATILSILECLNGTWVINGDINY